MAEAIKLNGVEKAAVLLMTMGEQAAAEILKHMGPKEVQKIGIAMASLQNVSKETVNATMADFVNSLHNQTSLGVGSDEYIRSVLVNALGEEKAATMIDRILLGGNTKGLESLKWMDPRAVAELIRLEHPQIIAIVLSYLEADQAAAVLQEFPEKVRSDLVLRVATLNGVQPSAMQELNDILERQLKGGGGGLKSSSIGGVKCAANILNFVDGSVGNKVMDAMKDADADLCQSIQDLMFVFDDLVEVDNRGIQTLLREVSSETLVLALKGADDGIKQKILSNMSQRAAEMLREDLESRGPVKLSDVETAQKEIITIARRLADEGQIVLAGAGEQMV
ncbi:MAG: flagellar motor switch protein FliG [Gammaproteobacteria bacterium]